MCGVKNSKNCMKSESFYALSEMLWSRCLQSFACRNCGLILINDLLSFRYEKEGRGRKSIKAQQLWYAIIEAQTETGTPYMLYKDACNRKSNQQNLGTIKCSNLCTEIVEYSSPDEVTSWKSKIIQIR